MGWDNFLERIRNKKNGGPTGKDDATSKNCDVDPIGHAGETEELSSEAAAAVAVAYALMDAASGKPKGKEDVDPEMAAAIALALFLRDSSMEPASEPIAQNTSDAWTQCGRIMAVTDRLRAFNR
jgi:hypothetical protein